MPSSLHLDSHGYLSTVMKESYYSLIDNLEITIEENDVNMNEKNDHLITNDFICAYCQDTCRIAAAINHNLTISKVNARETMAGAETGSDEIIDLEFDANILIICWDEKGRCLILADDGGNLHLVTSTGAILFSKKITTANSNCDIVALSIIENRDRKYSSIICFLENGGVFAVDQVPIDQLCSSPQNIGGLMQQLKFSKYSTPYQTPQKVVIFSLDQSLQAMLVDQYSRLHLLDMGTASTLVVTSILDFPDSEKYVDISIITHLDCCWALLLSDSQHLSVFDLHEQSQLCSANLGGIVSPLLTQMNSILSTSIISHNDDFKCIAFSVISIPDQDNDEVPQDSGIHSYLILNNTRFICVDTTTLSSNNSEPLSYAVGLYNSQTTSSLFAASIEINEFSILAHSTKLASVVSSIFTSFNFLSDSFSENDDIDMPLVYHDSLSVVGYLLCRKFPSSLPSQIQQNFQNMSPDEILTILKLFLQNSTCDEETYVNLLLTAQQIIVCDQDTEDENVEELEVYVNAFLTALECNWQLTSHLSQRQTDVTKRLFEDEMTVTETPSSSPELSYSSLIGKLATQQSWEFCLKNGLFPSSSVIFRRLLNQKLPQDPSMILPLVKLNNRSISDFIDWMQSDILPSMTENVLSTEKVCEYLARVALETEERDQHPYNSILITELALNIASALLMNYSSNDILQRVQTMHVNMSLQLAIWSEWNEQVSYREISEGKIIGIFSRRIRNLSVTNPRDDIQQKIRPLLIAYEPNFDSMLYQWILDTVQSSVILILEPDNTEIEAHTDDHDAMHIGRLIAVAESLEVPNFQAKAIICLLQTLSLPHIAASLEMFTSYDSSSLDDGMIKACYNRLYDLSNQLNGQVSAPIADALAEAFRSYKLRQLAIKYRIKGFNPREPRQVRDAISLILSKIHVATSIQDAISFAEGYSTSGVDLSNILVKSLVHRILPVLNCQVGNVTNEGADKDNMIRAALSHIPSDKFQIVVEDTCDYLLSLLDDVSSSSLELGMVAGCVEKANEEIFSSSTSGSLVIVNYFLDNAASNPTTVSSDQSNQGDSEPKKITAQSSSSCLTTDMQSTLKRIKKLIFEFSIYLAPNQLRDSKVCSDILTRAAIGRTDEIINLYLNDDSQRDVPEVIQQWTPQLLKLRKLCLLLDGSFVALLSSMMKHCLIKGQMELGMCFAEFIAVERKDISLGNSHHPRKGVSLGNFNESEIVINSAITLCGVAAKKAQESGQQRQDRPRRPGRPTSGGNDAPLSDITPFALSSELLRLTVLTCGGNSLGKTIDLLNSCELVIDVHKRLEGQSSVGNIPQVEGSSQPLSTPSSSTKYPYPLSAFKQTHGWNYQTEVDIDSQTKSATSSVDTTTLHQLQHQISGVRFIRDGILMSTSMIWGPLLRYILMETKRREGTLSVEQIPDDIDKLVATLQRTENHLLAARVILSTWSSYHGKKQVIPPSTLSNFVKSFYTSMMALGRKIITYRDVDIAFAVACLATIPFEAMVKELKSAVPSIQSDFSRLRTVALIGEQLAQMWQQEDSLLLFQSLQTNAKWWHILSSYGIKIDSRAFQSSNVQQRDECIRGIVPELLKKTGDISLAMEYCNQYDLEAHYASTCYIKYILLSKPIQISSSLWSNNIKKVCSSVEERLIISSLQQILPNIHPLDYEKISFTCKWLIDIIAEEDFDHARSRDDDSEDEDRIQKLDRSSTTIESYRALVDECTNYLNIATLLMNLPISTKMDSLFPVLTPLYEALSPEYNFRLPFWKLISEPWELLEPLMISDSDIGPKLAPLCPFLNIERDEFYVKRAIHLYTRSSIQSATEPSFTTQLSPQMESLLKDIDDIASCTKKPLTRVKIWRLVYEMEKDRNSNIALKALETALEVFDQISSINAISESEQQTYNDIKYETILEMVKHKSKEVLLEMQSCKSRIIRHDADSLWKEILCYESIILKLTPHLGDIASLLKVFFENILQEVWVLQLHILRNTSNVLAAYDLFDQKLLPIVAEYLRDAGEVARKLYQIHIALDSNQEKKEDAPSNILTSSILQSVRHSMIGKLLADVDMPDSDSHSRVMKSAAQGSNNQSGSLGNGLWGTIASSDSVVSPSSAEFRRREDIYRAFGIATLLASCTPTCPSLLLINQLLAVGKGANTRSQRRLTARSKFRAVQAILFLPQLQEILETGDISNEEQLKWLPLLRDHEYLYSLRGYLYCLAELQELRLPCSDETLAYALQHDVNAYCAGTQSATAIPSLNESIEQIISLVNTWIHDEGHHSDVCELARDLLLVSQCWNAQIWVKLISHVLNRNFVRLLFHTLVTLRKLTLFSLLLSDGYLCKLVSEAIQRSSYDITDKLEQMYELLSSRDSNTEEQPKKLSGEISQQTFHKKIALYCLDSPHSCRNWDESPEDLALISYRLDLSLSKMSNSNRFITTDITMGDYLALCQRLLSLSRRYQEHSLYLIDNGNDDLDTLRQASVEELLAHSTLTIGLSIISHLKPVIQGAMSNKIRLLNRIKVPRDNLIPCSYYEEFASKSLQILSPSPKSHHQLFYNFFRCLLTFAMLSSTEVLHSILNLLLLPVTSPSQDTTPQLLEVLQIFGKHYDVSPHEMNSSRKAFAVIMGWVESSEERRVRIEEEWKSLSDEQRKSYQISLRQWQQWGLEMKIFNEYQK